MRVMHGTLQGRTVTVPPGEIRPIMDRMREALFALLGDLEDHSFLDLFTGSGIVALEAYSRGARPVACVEKDRGKRRVLSRNLAGLDPEISLFLEPVERFVLRDRRVWDVVYLDPPFPYRFRRDLLQKLARSRLLGPESRVLIHVPKSDPLPERIGSLQQTDQRRFGGSLLYSFSPVASE